MPTGRLGYVNLAYLCSSSLLRLHLPDAEYCYHGSLPKRTLLSVPARSLSFLAPRKFGAIIPPPVTEVTSLRRLKLIRIASKQFSPLLLPPGFGALAASLTELVLECADWPAIPQARARAPLVPEEHLPLNPQNPKKVLKHPLLLPPGFGALAASLTELVLECADWPAIPQARARAPLVPEEHLPLNPQNPKKVLKHPLLLPPGFGALAASLTELVLECADWPAIPQARARAPLNPKDHLPLKPQNPKKVLKHPVFLPPGFGARPVSPVPHLAHPEFCMSWSCSAPNGPPSPDTRPAPLLNLKTLKKRAHRSATGHSRTSALVHSYVSETVAGGCACR